MTRGDHACLIYDDPARRDAMLLDFLNAGIDAGERVVYVAEGADRRVIDHLTRRAAAGQVEVQDSVATFLADGTFEPDRVLGAFRSARDESVAGGFPALRAGGEPPTVLRRNGQARRLTEYERRVNELFEDQAMVALCAYDTRTTDPNELWAIADAHPMVLFAVGPHPRLRVKAEERRLELSGWLDLTTLGGLVGPISDAVAGGGDVEVELGNVEFIDVAGLRLFVETAELLHEQRGSLTLRSAPEWIPGILDILGYERQEGLVLQ